MRSYTVEQLITKAQIRGGYESSGRMTSAKWLDWLESGLAELHDLLISKYGEDYVTARATSTFTINQDYIAIPALALKVLGLDVQVGGEWVATERFQLAERNLFQSTASALAAGSPYVRHRIEGDQILLQPTPKSADSYRLIYVKRAPKLALTGGADEPNGIYNVIDGYNGWEELAVLYALLRAKRSQDEPTDGIEREIDRLQKRVEWAADGRNAGQPMSIADLDDGSYV
jgi:hypothetical protein